MFELEEQIHQWRQLLRQGQTYREEDLSELEDHLRATIGELGDAGLSQEEAFLIACRRLGDAEALTGEYAKVNSERAFQTKLIWMANGLLGCYLCHQLAGILANSLILVTVSSGVTGASLGWLSLLFQISSVLLFLWIILRLLKRVWQGLSTLVWPKAGWLALLVGLGFALARGVNTLSCVLLARTMPLNEFGRISLYRGYVEYFGPLAAVLLICCLIFKLRPDASSSRVPAADPTLPDSH